MLYVLITIVLLADQMEPQSQERSMPDLQTCLSMAHRFLQTTNPKDIGAVYISAGCIKAVKPRPTEQEG